MNIVYTRIGSFITEDNESKIRDKLSSNSGVAYLQEYFRIPIQRKEATKVLKENYFIEDYRFE
jgi:hypothetical protein